jgi:hypothetical protein
VGRIIDEMHMDKDYIMRLQVIKINTLLKAFLIFPQVQEGVDHALLILE